MCDDMSKEILDEKGNVVAYFADSEQALDYVEYMATLGKTYYLYANPNFVIRY